CRAGLAHRQPPCGGWRFADAGALTMLSARRSYARALSHLRRVSMFDPWFWSVAVATIAIVALSKSGFLGSLGMMGVPLLSLLMPAKEAAGMLLPLLCLMDVIGLLAFHREFDARNIRIMLVGGLIGTLVGWALWSVITDAEVLLIVGLITMLFVIDAVVPWRRRLAEGAPPSPPWGVFWGAVSGLTSFISHAGGPPAQVYLPPNIYSGTTVVFFAAVNKKHHRRARVDVGRQFLRQQVDLCRRASGVADE